jgi:hypothetical protein
MFLFLIILATISCGISCDPLRPFFGRPPIYCFQSVGMLRSSNLCQFANISFWTIGAFFRNLTRNCRIFDFSVTSGAAKCRQYLPRPRSSAHGQFLLAILLHMRLLLCKLERRGSLFVRQYPICCELTPETILLVHTLMRTTQTYSLYAS